MANESKTIAVSEEAHQAARILAALDRTGIGEEVEVLIMREAASRNIKLPDSEPAKDAN